MKTFPDHDFKLSCGDDPKVRQWLHDNGVKRPHGVSPLTYRSEVKLLYVRDKSVCSGLLDAVFHESKLVQINPYDYMQDDPVVSLESGSDCPVCLAKSSIEAKEPEECYCHISSPCHYHADAPAECTECHEVFEDWEYLPEPTVKQSLSTDNMAEIAARGIKKIIGVTLSDSKPDIAEAGKFTARIKLGHHIDIRDADVINRQQAKALAFFNKDTAGRSDPEPVLTIPSICLRDPVMTHMMGGQFGALSND